MSLIHVLDESTINQIAAGEVVERPSAVVKELVENAMDAGATAITAEIKEGGLSLIRITDNGSGIAKEDIPLAFLRHATSKIHTAEDLLNVTSLGFRGEALSSIAAVSQVELITKTPSAINGYRYLIDGGEEKIFEEIGCPSGTTIIVRNIFYNTPARRKFLKSAMTEAGYISDLMERLIVSHPDVSFKFIINNQVKLQSSGNNNSKDILYQIYGRDITRELLPVEYVSEGIRVSGFIGKPAINRGNRNFENYFINGRYIKSNIITKAIEESYKPFLMQHKYPLTSIYFEIDPSVIDVNVHPQKMEIRLKNSEEIYQLTFNIIRNSLAGKEMIPKVSLTEQRENRTETTGLPEPFEQNRRKQFEESKYIDNLIGKHNQYGAQNPDYNKSAYTPGGVTHEQNAYSKSTPYDYHKVAEKNTDYITATEPLINSESPIAGVITGSDKNISTVLKEAIGAPENKPENKRTDLEQMYLFHDSQVADTPFLSKQALEEHRIIGQIFATYWLVEFKKELYIIDQHAAHEKVLFERLMTAAKAKTYESQQLYPPIVLTLTLKEQEILQRYEEELKTLGYEFEYFGGKEYSVRAVPADLFNISEKELLLEFLDTLADEFIGGAPGGVSVLERAASLSCKAAVKANHILTHKEASNLIKELLTLDNPYHCPHGRPVIVSMSQYELERKFKRIL